MPLFGIVVFIFLYTFLHFFILAVHRLTKTRKDLAGLKTIGATYSTKMLLTGNSILQDLLLSLQCLFYVLHLQRFGTSFHNILHLKRTAGLPFKSQVQLL